MKPNGDTEVAVRRAGEAPGLAVPAAEAAKPSKLRQALDASADWVGRTLKSFLS